MKHVKINIINHLGKKTSTTININIALYYYKFCVPMSAKEYIKEYPLEHQYAAAVAHRDKSIQDFANTLIQEAINPDQEYPALGVNKDYIESMLLNEIAFNQA